MPNKECEEQIPSRSMNMYENSVSHLNLFGCVENAHVPNEIRRKINSKGEKYIFVGYSKDTKAYKLYDPVTRKVIISRYVQFVENEAWDGTVKKNVKIVSMVKHDDMVDEVVQITHAIQNFVALTTPMMTRHVSTQGTSTQVISQATPMSTPRSQ